MSPETIARLLEYFDLKGFFEANSPIRLAIIFCIMAVFGAIVHFVSGFIQRKLEKYVLAKEPINPDPREGPKGSVKQMDVRLFERVIRNTRRVFYLIILYWGLSRLVIGPLYAEVVRTIFIGLCIWAGIEFFTAFVPFNIDLYLRRRGATLQTSKSRSLLPIIKGLIWAIGLTFLLDNLGFHVSTIIAGLGIVGVAVGLAGQAILADFFSYIVILLDKPFRIGDFVELDDGKCGDVEYMGPKTTHLRNLEDDLIVCANSMMTKGILINKGSIREREVVVQIGVAYDTPTDTLKRMPEILKAAVESVESCRFDRACLLSFGNSNLNYQLLYFVSGRREEIRAFMNIRSEVNVAILAAFNREGISMAFPTEHVLFTDLDQQTLAPKPAGAPEKSVIKTSRTQTS